MQFAKYCDSRSKEQLIVKLNIWNIVRLILFYKQAVPNEQTESVDD